MAEAAPEPCDLLLRGAAVVSWEGATPEGADAVAVGDGRVLAVGRADDLARRFAPRATTTLDGGLLAPAFVDAHTHPVFAAERAEEFDLKCRGASYLEVAAAGGGILASVRAVRAAGEDELAARVVRNLRRMQRHGTLTCEAKSGYGLSVADELKSLRALARAADEVGVTVLPTFLGAHAVPEEFRDDPDRYVDVLCEEALPAVVEEGLARAADVFVEEGAFSVAQARRYLERARELGLALRVHADQFHALGGVELAVELGAESVDHLEALTDAGLEALALSRRTFAGLLPVVPHFCAMGRDAPARRLIQAGVPWFVATDFNPGSSYTPSPPEAAHFARRRLGLSAEEALRGVTEHAAASLGLADRGRIAPGAVADLVHLDLPGVASFGYALGENPVRALWRAGRPVPVQP